MLKLDDIPHGVRRYKQVGLELYKGRLLLSGTKPMQGSSMWREYLEGKKHLRQDASFSHEFTAAGTSGKTKDDRREYMLKKHYMKEHDSDDLSGFDVKTYTVKKYHTIYRKYGAIVSQLTTPRANFLLCVMWVQRSESRAADNRVFRLYTGELFTQVA